MTYQTILLDKSDGVAEITLNRPSALNAFDVPMAEELLDAVIRCSSDDDVRALIFTGAGNAFSAGGDIRSMTESLDSDPAVFFGKVIASLDGVVSSITRMRKPVLAAVNGVAAGAAFSFVLACDLAIASDKARFISAYTGIGMAPDLGLTLTLPRIIGPKRALELIYSNRPLEARAALELGMVNEVVSSSDLMPRARAFARELAQGPIRAFGTAKVLVHSSQSETLETQMEQERQEMGQNARTADFREGVQAFLEKRKARFEGR